MRYNRVRWWAGFKSDSGVYTTWQLVRYRFAFTLGSRRCHHVNRFRIRCFRELTYDGWCGMHNSLDACRGHMMDFNDHRKGKP